MKTRGRQLIIFLIGALTGIFVISQFGYRQINQDIRTKNNSDSTKIIYHWSTPALPAAMSFAGEEVPLQREEIREQLDREFIINCYNPGNILYILKLSKRYFPIIEDRLKANGVPDDFKYLCVAESSLQNAISKAGAVGFWQFMSSTSPGYNLEVNKEVDERYNIIKSTDGACKYLKLAYSKFGNWTAAAASYNCGQGGYNSQSEFQQTKNYYGLYLPEETNRYIFRILTLKYILSHSKEMGFHLTDEDLYKDINTRTITVNSSINSLSQWALDRGTTYKMVRRLNPWLRSKSLTVKANKSYEIKIPEK